MSKYLRTSGISSGIDDLIREAKERLYIISPYLKLSDNVKELLNDKEREKVEVRIIFGKQELNPTEMSYLQKLKYVRLYFSKNLHAKCYLNEKKMIITSMNLYEFSQQHNKEMGILIDREDENDKKVYDDAWKDIESILNNADDFSYIEAPKSNGKTEVDSKKVTSKSQNGYCIRTGEEIPFNIEKPMSYEAFKSWNKYKDKEYSEKFCHFSGEHSHGETSVGKPVLNKYWKKAQEIHGLVNTK
ncbi:MAG TPA: phospholipase D family protein [Cytophagaceae bacterium]|jgi:phosphatidylserine/phosphatidylglycerophosphate/cardiolipin synthase-like enzyme|nr:phospholipase D family protein [Cytophagaceae bacterium]